MCDALHALYGRLKIDDTLLTLILIQGYHICHVLCCLNMLPVLQMGIISAK